MKIKKIDANLIEKVTGLRREVTDEYLSIYIGLDNIYVAEATNTAGVLNTISLVKVPIKGVDIKAFKSSEMNKEFFKDRHIWLEPVRKIFAEKKFKNKQVCITLSPEFSIYRHFVMPTIERKFWRQSIPIQAKKYIHFPFEQAMYSYDVYNFETKISKQKKLGVLFGLTDKYIVEEIKKGMKELKLDLRGLEISIISLSRLLSMKDKGSKESGQIYGYFSDDKASFLFINKAKPLLQKDINFSGMYTTERRKLEITSYVDFISNQFEKDPFKETVLLGGVQKKTWGAMLESVIAKPIRELDINEILGFESRGVEELACIGGCFKYAETFGINLDLSGEQRSAKMDNKVLTFLWKIVGICIMILLVMCLVTQVKSYMVGQELKKARTSGALMQEFSNMNASSIKNKIEETEREERMLTELFDIERVTPAIARMTEIIPEDMWITKLSYRYPMFAGKSKISKAKEFVLSGFMFSEMSRKKELEIGDEFREAITKDEIFKNLCSMVSTGIRYKVPTETSTKKNEATQFTLECK